jgi:hypothetical protein
MEYVNPVIVLILVAEVCLGICAWHSPRFLRRVAAHLLTRADVLDIFRQENIRRMQFWIAKFGLEADTVRAEQHVVLTDLPGMKQTVFSLAETATQLEEGTVRH